MSHKLRKTLIIFINDPPDVFKSALFAADTNICRPIKHLFDLEIVLLHLFSICDMSDDWLLRFNVLNCKYIRNGNVKFISDEGCKRNYYFSVQRFSREGFGRVISEQFKI